MFSPSSAPAHFPERCRRAESELTRRFGRADFGPCWANARDERAGSPRERATELHHLVASDSTRLLMASTGGYSANEILPHLDFAELAQKRPLICGYSDVSLLLMAIHAMTGLVVFHGPTALPTYGEVGGADDWTQDRLLEMLTTEDEVMLAAPPAFTGESEMWDRADGQRRRRQPSDGWVTVCGGRARGRLLVGNLEALERLLATPYAPSFEGKILGVEEADAAATRTCSRLEHLSQAGALDGVAAILLGRPIDEHAAEVSVVHACLEELGARHGVPVLADVDFGHTEPRLTLPIGAPAELDADSKTLSVLMTRVT